MKEFKPVAWVIDGSYLLHRTYHAIRKDYTPKGYLSNAVQGTVNHVLGIVREFNPEVLVVVVDRPEPTFRHTLSKDYKANRPPYGEEFTSQIPWAIRFLEAYGIPVVSIPGYEGDDLIGTLATTVVSHGYHASIVTGDKDMMQLVSDDIWLVDRFKQTHTNREGVRERFNVYPESIADLLALMGDRADGIVGVSGVGAVGAANLINEFGTLDQIIEAAPTMRGFIGRNILNNVEQLRLARKLTGIVTDLDLGVTIDQLRVQSTNVEQLEALNREFWG